MRLRGVEARLHTVLLAARTIRNLYVHSRTQLAYDFEVLYVYKWLDTLLDVFLNAALGASRAPEFDFDAYLGSLPTRIASFRRRVAAGGSFQWMVKA
jgi:hypothetical protein